MSLIASMADLFSDAALLLLGLLVALLALITPLHETKPDGEASATGADSENASDARG